MKPTHTEEFSEEEKHQLLERMIREGTLPKPHRAHAGAADPLQGTPPRNQLESLLVDLLNDRQGSRIGVYDAIRLRPADWEALAPVLATRLETSIDSQQLALAPTLAAAAAMLEGRAQPQLELPPLVHADDEDPQPPLSPHQLRFWFFHQLEGLSPAFHLLAHLEFRGRLELDRLSQAALAVYARHRILRTSFPSQEGEPVQRTFPLERLTPTVIDLSGFPQPRVTADRIIALNGAVPLDPATGPLSRLLILRLAADHILLCLCQHQLVADTRSLQRFFEELATAYSGTPEVASVALNYSDFARWQWHNAKHHWQAQLHYWNTQLRGMPDRHQIPIDRPRPSIQRFKGGLEHFEVGPRLVKALSTLAELEGTSLPVVLATAFTAFIHRYTHAQDIVFGTRVSGREDAPGLLHLIGPVANALVLRHRLEDNPSFMTMLHRVRQTWDEAMRNRHLPFACLLEQRQAERDLSQNPLFQIEMIWDEGFRPVAFAGQTSQVNRDHARVSLNDLTLIWNSRDNHVHAELEYNFDLFDPATAGRMLRHFRNLLSALAKHQHLSIGELPLLTKEEAETMLVDWNTTAINLGPMACIQDLFHRQVQLTPDAPALIYSHHGGGEMTYAQLNAIANHLAHVLIERGIQPEQNVGLCCRRAPALVVGILAILKAGAAYTPLDPDFPCERLNFQLEDAAAPVLIVEHALRERFAKFGGTVLTIDRMGHVAQGGHRGDNPVGQVRDYHRASLCYTSGSEGLPKGVVTTHRALVNRLRWAQEVFPLAPQDRFLTLAPAHFDIALWEALAPLISGAQLILALPEAHKDISQLVQLLIEYRISAMHVLPSVLQALLQESRIFSATQLRLVFCGGEPLPLATVVAFYRKMPGRLIHFYGPTEAAINVTSDSCRADLQLVSIGRPIANTALYVLDRFFHPVPTGVTGELFIAGTALARGYEGQPGLTAQAFVPNPFAGEHPFAGAGSRLYRTGDLARFAPGGKIIFLGRRDRQVKINGFRVELDEIERLLERAEKVASCTVVCYAPSEGLQRLVAYVSPVEGLHVSASELNEHLSRHLPESMVPSAYIILGHLPRLANGKVDRHALPKPGSEWITTSVPYVPPRTREEHVLAALWARLLGLDRVGIHDNFFGLGGNSMLTIRMEAQAIEAGIPLSTRKVFEKPTIAQLVSTLGEGQELPTPNSYVVNGRFAAQVAEQGEAIALIEENGTSTTYAQLAEQAEAVATRLARLGLGRGHRIGLCAEGKAAVVGLLAALRSGAACAWLPPDWPKELHHQACQHLDLDAVLVDHSARLDDCAAPLLSLQASRAAAPLKDPPLNTDPALIAIDRAAGSLEYMRISHLDLVHTLASLALVPGMTRGDVFLLLEPLAPPWLLWPLLEGACLVLPKPGTPHDTVAVNRLIQRTGTTTVMLARSGLQTFLKALRPGDASLKLILDGEIPVPEARTLLGRYRQIWHLLGYPEACFCSGRGLVDARALEVDHAHVGISGPVHGAWLYILDETLQPIKPGVWGELYIGGKSLASGYLDDPRRTAERFVPDPFAHGEHGRLFRTGRRAFFLTDGRIFFP